MSTSTRTSRPQQGPRPGRQPRRPRKAPDPVHGTARWLSQPSPSWDTPARLQIAVQTGKGVVVGVYAVSPIRSDGGPHFGGQIVGYRLEKEGDGGEVYDIDTTPVWGATCSCPDSAFREARAETPEARACKHVMALEAALAALPSAA